MADILDRIDATLGGQCPCGAPPKPGSAYCGDDCTPTWHARDTVSDLDGTPMRWRPDLVTASDDSGLTLVHEFRRGRHNAQVFEREGTDRLHCRLDDGHRFAGTDTDGCQLAQPDGLNPVWERLEQELTKATHLEVDPWADVMGGCSDEDFVGWINEALNRAEFNQRACRLAWGGGPDALTGAVFIAPIGTDPDDRSQWARIGEVRSVTLVADNSRAVFRPIPAT